MLAYQSLVMPSYIVLPCLQNQMLTLYQYMLVKLSIEMSV